jgi:predicted DNA-binding transcriptional regulator YafY
MRRANLTGKHFEARPGFEPRGLRDARQARIWYSPRVARWRLERGGASELSDGAALAETAVGSPEWLVGEILSNLGDAVVLEPKDLRELVATRARKLAAALAKNP